jgi:hypothetical protein
MMDLSIVSDEDLKHIASGDMSKVSTATLQQLAKGSPAPNSREAFLQHQKDVGTTLFDTSSEAAGQSFGSPQSLESGRRRFVANQGTRMERLKDFAQQITSDPVEVMTGETAPATGVVDWATRVAPESAGKLIPRTIAAFAQTGKSMVDPYVDAIDNIREGYPVADSLAKGSIGSLRATRQGIEDLAGFAADRLGFHGWNTAKEGLLTDPAGTAAVIKGGLEMAKPGLSKLSDFAEPRPIDQQLSSAITNGIEKGIRPGVGGNKTYAQSQGYMAKAQNAVKTILENKDNLVLTDEYGEVTGQLPQNLKQFSQAIDQTKSEIFNRYNEMAVKSGERGAQVDLTPIADELATVANNKVLQDSAPEVAAYAKKRAEAYKPTPSTDGISTSTDRAYTAEQAQNAISIFNQSLDAFYKNPSYDTASRAYIDSLIVNNLRKGLDNAIEQATGPGYQELKNSYGALKSIEKDVARRSIVDARKNAKGLIDFSDIFSGSEVVRGLLTMNPAAVGTGVAAKMISALYKLKNDPNRVVKGMFEKADKLYTPEGLPETPDLSPLPSIPVASYPAAGKVGTLNLPVGQPPSQMSPRIPLNLPVGNGPPEPLIRLNNSINPGAKASYRWENGELMPNEN